MPAEQEATAAPCDCRGAAGKLKWHECLQVCSL